MKNCRKNALKTSNGITLIALVITIIVLLILAGISIGMLSGNNGILKKSRETRTKTERASVIEQAQTDILGQIAENKGEALTETQLKTILGSYFEEFDDELTEDLSETTITLTAKNEYGGYSNIALADIYNGKILKDNTNLYHIKRNTEMYKNVAYLCDKDENIIPILAEYNARIISFENLSAYSINPSIGSIQADGGIQVLCGSSMANGKVVLGITYNGVEVTGEISVYPEG